MRRFILYPFLFVVYLVISLVVSNLTQLDAALAWSPLFWLLLLAAIGLSVFSLVLKDWHYAAYLVFLILCFFFLFGHLNRVAGNWFPQYRNVLSLVLPGVWWLLLGLLASKKVWSWLGGARRVTPYLNLVFLLAIALQVAVGISAWIQSAARFSQWTESAPLWQPDETLTSLDCQNRPDIYYIIVDGYGRQDVLKNLYQIDNGPFLQALRDKGFYVVDQAHANYTQTVYSLSSSLNMNYLKHMPDGESVTRYFSEMIMNNRVFQVFEKCGYQTIAIESGFHFTNRLPVDIYLSETPHLNEFAALLLTGSPLDVLAKVLYSKESDLTLGYEMHRNWIRFNFKSLAEIPDMPGPKLVFAHILAPHPPFVFDATGGPVDPDRDYEIVDGSAFAGSWKEYQTGYSAQIKFVDAELSKAIDAILARSTTPPVIVIQGDHGPGSLLDWENVDATCLWERTSILNAYYLPDGGTDLLYPGITPVNTFRIILDHYLNANLDLLPDRVYYSSFVHRPPVIDVTEWHDSEKNCKPPN